MYYYTYIRLKLYSETSILMCDFFYPIKMLFLKKCKCGREGRRFPGSYKRGLQMEKGWETSAQRKGRRNLTVQSHADLGMPKYTEIDVRHA